MNKQIETAQEEQWTKVISPKKGWFDINLSNLWNYRDLIMLFVKRDFVSFYKQTILGPLWFLLQPLFTTIVFTIIFGRIAQISTDGLPKMLFYMCGIVIWNYFADCLNKTSDTFVSNCRHFWQGLFPPSYSAALYCNNKSHDIRNSIFLVPVILGLFLFWRGCN